MKRITPLIAVMLVTAVAAFAVAGTESTPNCTEVAGQMTVQALNLKAGRIGATMTGDIQALRGIQIVDVDVLLTPAGFVTLIKGRGVIVTEKGTMRTRDRIFLKRVTPGEPPRNWRGFHRIVHGNGEFEGASGIIRTDGIIGPGRRSLEYTGEVCVPTQTQ
jgi:hypothetical protein